jgi:O-antigen/teichoic acid export membrane protein
MNPDNRAADAVNQMSVLATGRLMTHAILLVSAVLIPRIMGVEAFGLYAGLMAVVAILDSAATGGLQMAELRYFAPMWRDGDRPFAIKVGSTLWTARLFLSTVAGGVAVVWLGWLSDLAIDWTLALLVALFLTLRAALEATRHLFLSVQRAMIMVTLDVGKAVLVLVVVLAAFDEFGLEGVFSFLGIGTGVMLIVAATVLFRTAPLNPKEFSFERLRPYLRFSVNTLAGSLAWAAQAQFATFAVASWVSLDEAAVVGVTVQVYVFFQTLIITVRAAVVPVMADFYESRQHERLKTWGEILLRWGTAAGVIGVASWALLGDQLLRVLPTDFEPVHESGTIILASVVFLGGAAVCNGFLYAAGHAGPASLNRGVFAGITIVSLVALITASQEVTALQVSWIYLGASVVFLVSTYIAMGARLHIWLSLRGALLLWAPLVPAVFLGWWSGPVLARSIALAVYIALFLIWGTALGALPLHELATVRQARRMVANEPAT